MPLNGKDARDILETLAFQDISGAAQESGSRIAKVAPGSWQAKMIADAAGVTRAQTSDDLRAAMTDPAAPVIFLPRTAMVSHEIIMKICRESGLRKILIWEAE